MSALQTIWGKIKLSKLELLIVLLVAAVLISFLVTALLNMPIELSDPKPKLPPSESNRIHHPKGFSIIAPEGWTTRVETKEQGKRDSIFIQLNVDARFCTRLSVTLFPERPNFNKFPFREGYKEGRFKQYEAFIFDGDTGNYYQWNSYFHNQDKWFFVTLWLPNGDDGVRYHKIPDYWWPFIESFQIDSEVLESK